MTLFDLQDILNCWVALQRPSPLPDDKTIGHSPFSCLYSPKIVPLDLFIPGNQIKLKMKKISDVNTRKFKNKRILDFIFYCILYALLTNERSLIPCGNEESCISHVDNFISTLNPMKKLFVSVLLTFWSFIAQAWPRPVEHFGMMLHATPRTTTTCLIIIIIPIVILIVFLQLSNFGTIGLATVRLLVITCATTWRSGSGRVASFSVFLFER